MKRTIAVLFGGCSSEYDVSLQSAYSVSKAISTENYNRMMIGITREGDWYLYEGALEWIPKDTWRSKGPCIPAQISLNRQEHGLLIFREGEKECIPLDGVLPILHGKNGEDGTVQGVCELAGIPVIGCGSLASALCMDKHRAHLLARQAGVEIPRGVCYEAGTSLELIEAEAEGLGYPLFVKPLRAGSSFGITKVDSREKLGQAIEQAFVHDSTVIVEELVEGFEVGCAVIGKSQLITGRADEIELSKGFFDYTEKYTLKTSQIHMPARVSVATESRIQETAKQIYRALGCSGFARVDMFLRPDGTLVFNEVNTIPGFTSHSRFPNMMKGVGYSFEEVVALLLEEGL